MFLKTWVLSDYTYFNRLCVIQVSTQVHQQLGHPGGHIIRAGENTSTQAKNTSMAPDQIYKNISDYVTIRENSELLLYCQYNSFIHSFIQFFLPADGIVSTEQPSSLFLFLGKQVLQRASKCACIGASMDRKLHWRKPLSVVAAISLTWLSKAERRDGYVRALQCFSIIMKL